MYVARVRQVASLLNSSRRAEVSDRRIINDGNSFTLYSAKVIIVLRRIIWIKFGTLAVDGWAVTFGTAMRGGLRQCVPITVLLCNGPLVRGFNVPV